MWSNPQFPADLVLFIEEILNGKLHFLCSVQYVKHQTLSDITAQKNKFSIKDFFNKCDQIHRKSRIYSHLLKKSLKENFIFSTVHHKVHSIQTLSLKNYAINEMQWKGKKINQ